MTNMLRYPPGDTPPPADAGGLRRLDEAQAALAAFAAAADDIVCGAEAAVVALATQFGQALTAIRAWSHRLTWRGADRRQRRHRRRCRICNPRGNPLPLAVDGDAYRRRRAARAARRQR